MQSRKIVKTFYLRPINCYKTLEVLNNDDELVNLIVLLKLEDKRHR